VINVYEQKDELQSLATVEIANIKRLTNLIVSQIGLFHNPDPVFHSGPIVLSHPSIHFSLSFLYLCQVSYFSLSPCIKLYFFSRMPTGCRCSFPNFN